MHDPRRARSLLSDSHLKAVEDTKGEALRRLMEMYTEDVMTIVENEVRRVLHAAAAIACDTLTHASQVTQCHTAIRAAYPQAAFIDLQPHSSETATTRQLKYWLFMSRYLKKLSKKSGKASGLPGSTDGTATPTGP